MSDYIISLETQTLYFELIRSKLNVLFGHASDAPVSEVSILSEFVWQMALEPSYGLDQLEHELKEFLGDSLYTFLEWLNEHVMTPLGPARASAETNGVPVTVETGNSSPTSPTKESGYEEEEEEIEENDNGEEYDEVEPQSQSPQSPEKDMAAIQGEIATAFNSGRKTTLLKVKKRCARFPSCPFGDMCRYIHPNEQCLTWPRCLYGSECFYIHPKIVCKYGINCNNWYCNFTHPDGWSPSMPAASWAHGII